MSQLIGLNTVNERLPTKTPVEFKQPIKSVRITFTDGTSKEIILSDEDDGYYKKEIFYAPKRKFTEHTVYIVNGLERVFGIGLL